MDSNKTVTAPVRKFLSFPLPWWIEEVALLLIVISIGSAIYFRNEARGFENNLSVFAELQKTALQYSRDPSFSKADFLTNAKEQFVESKGDFIYADLGEMKLGVYKGGKLSLEVPIKTKGREGSWWETPAGLYAIETKEKNHFSSFGKVYQPWSMSFQGNFFIHGWPNYPDGTPVSSAYSGGCIRLSNEDAEKVYREVDVGTPVIVYEKDFGSDGKNFIVRTPSLTATNYLAADIGSNFVFLGKDTSMSVPIASLTKLVTALVASEYINLDKSIFITENMLASTTKPRLKAGQEISAYQLLFPLLLESSNEAAEALALSLGRDRFIALMNKKALSLGMEHTHFVDPTGKGEGNISTTEDLFSLARYLANNRSFIFNVTSGKLTTSIYGAPSFSGLQNFNDFGDSLEFRGGKVGKTTVAGETGIYLFQIPFENESRLVAVIVLGSIDRKGDAEKILEYVKENFE